MHYALNWIFDAFLRCFCINFQITIPSLHFIHTYQKKFEIIQSYHHLGISNCNFDIFMFENIFKVDI